MVRAAIRLCVMLALLVGLVAAPAAAQGPPPEPEGGRINILACVFGPPGNLDCITEYPAGMPFFVLHGFGMEHGKGYNQKRLAPANGQNDFVLFVDGVEVDETWMYHGRATTLNLFQFEGLPAGLHTFRGQWWVPCWLDDVGVEPGCDKPSGTATFGLDFTITVEFLVP